MTKNPSRLPLLQPKLQTRSQVFNFGATTPPISLLIVDDDIVSIRAVTRTLRKLALPWPYRVAKDGQEAIDILRGTSGYEKLPAPYLVTLDLNMPRMDGHEFLAELRADPNISRTLVFVMTTSKTPEDIAACYEKNIAGYIIKEDVDGGFAHAFEMINAFINSVQFPSHPETISL